MTAVMTYDTLVDDLKAYTANSTSNYTNQIPRIIMMAENNMARDLKMLGVLVSYTNTMTVGEMIISKPPRWRATVSFNIGTAEVLSTTYRSADAGVRTLVLSGINPYAVGDSITVSGVGGTGYNGTFTLTAVTSDSITYSNGATTEATTADAGGSAYGTLSTRKPLLLRPYENLRNYWPTPTNTDEPAYYADYDYDHWFVAASPKIAYPFETLIWQKVQGLDSSNQTNWFTEFAPDLLLYACLKESYPFLKNTEMMPVWDARYQAAMGGEAKQEIQRMNDRAQNAAQATGTP